MAARSRSGARCLCLTTCCEGRGWRDDPPPHHVLVAACMLQHMVKGLAGRRRRRPGQRDPLEPGGPADPHGGGLPGWALDPGYVEGNISEIRLNVGGGVPHIPEYPSQHPAQSLMYSHTIASNLLRNQRAFEKGC